MKETLTIEELKCFRDVYGAMRNLTIKKGR